MQKLSTTENVSKQNWPVLLFKKSVLKQRKYKELTALLGPPNGLHCLDIGSDNGVISYLFRQRGGTWKSADLDIQSVSAIKALVESDVYQISDQRTPFQNDEFDRIIIVDFLEHIPEDKLFICELFRVMKPGGRLVVNVPHIKDSWLRRFRLAIGQTDEKHGHLRPGYTVESLENILDGYFSLETTKTYSKFFSELIDTLIVQAIYLLQRRKKEKSKKGALVTGTDLKNYKLMFRAYSVIYPVVWLFSKLDGLLFFTSGYMLIATAKVNKEAII